MDRLILDGVTQLSMLGSSSSFYNVALSPQCPDLAVFVFMLVWRLTTIHQLSTEVGYRSSVDPVQQSTNREGCTRECSYTGSKRDFSDKVRGHSRHSFQFLSCGVSPKWPQ